MPSRCIFNLEKESEVYNAGEDTIIGHVTLVTTTVKQIKQIKIRFKGTSKVGFKMVFKYDKDQPPLVLDEYYLTSKEKIVKAEEVVRRPGILQPGTYTWPFSFTVPENCYTSMEGPSGHIRYQLSLKIYNEEKYKNLFLKPITVIKKDDLNLRKECIVPVETEAETTFCCGLISSGPRFHIEGYFSAYAPGQWLRYAVNIANKDATKEYVHEVSFIRQTRYKSTHPGKYIMQEETVFYMSNHRDWTGLTTQINEDAFYIPPTPPTMQSKYISVRYFLRVTLAVKCCPRTLKGELPIVIGTVPLKESLLPQHQRYAVQTHGDQYIITPSRYQRSEDSSFIDKNTEEINRVDDFAPKYPTYQFV